MENWCDDAIEPDEPEPRVDERWTIIGGTVSIEIEGELATGDFQDIVALTPDGREYPLGNASFGRAQVTECMFDKGQHVVKLQQNA